jgi:formylglycine-generating enzyme required for sulfatase activity
MSHVFISYSRQDQAYVHRLADDLRRRGFDVWIDDRIDYGDRWWQVVVRAVRDCGAFIVVMSPDAEHSEWVEREVLLAQRENKPIFPMLLEGKEFPLLITTQYADVQGGDFPQSDFFDRLRQVITPATEPGQLIAPSEPQIRRLLTDKAEQQPKAEPKPGIPRQWALLAVAVGAVAVIGISLAILSSLGLLSLSGPPASSLASREVALQRARDFQGGNEAWEPYVETFTFDDGVRIDLALVPVGSFQMGNDPEADDGAADGGEQSFTEPFWIGRTEVTNAQYMQCVRAGACDEPDDYGVDFNGPDQPVVGVSWFKARQFAEWLSIAGELFCALPTEAEWEYAARGPEAWFYPWGNEFDNARLNDCDSNCDDNSRDPAFDDGYAVTSPVGSYSPAGDSWVGAADMAGNASEWTATIYQVYPYDPGDGRNDLVDTTSARVARGGSWNLNFRYARAAYRIQDYPDLRVRDWGFRVVCRPPSP